MGNLPVGPPMSSYAPRSLFSKDCRPSFFSRVLRVGADQPMPGALPADAQALEDQADGLAAEPARRPALLEADLGGQPQRPQAGGLAEVAGRLVQQGAEVFVAFLGPGGVAGLGSGGLLAQAGQPLDGKGAQNVADGLRGAAQRGGGLGG